ncbi:MAG: histone deacetylase [Pseudomonadota bacterium]
MQFFASDDFSLPLPDGHRFPAEKYRLLRQELLNKDILKPGQLIPSPLASHSDILSTHDPSYVMAMEDGSIDPKIMRRIGFPWSPAIPRRGMLTTGGALAAARSALETGLSGQLAGGTHHAHYDYGAGFCIYNDLSIVTNILLTEGAASRVAIIDLDVHQGDGNAALLGDREDVFILDIFGEKNFPFRKYPAHLDVPLPDHCEDRDYLAALEQHLPAVWAFSPDIVLYQAGIDGLKSDKLGRLDLSFDGLKARDQLILQGCFDRNIPCSMAIGGGYADPIQDTVEAYANTYRVAKSIYGF